MQGANPTADPSTALRISTADSRLACLAHARKTAQIVKELFGKQIPVALRRRSPPKNASFTRMGDGGRGVNMVMSECCHICISTIFLIGWRCAESDSRCNLDACQKQLQNPCAFGAFTCGRRSTRANSTPITGWGQFFYSLIPIPWPVAWGLFCYA